MPVKIFSDLGQTDLGILIRGINYAADNGANVISMSWGTYSYSEILKDTIDYAYSKGSVLVASAGNEATYYKSYPASYDNVISVAAINSNNAKAIFSNYGARVDVAAPGVDIYSTMPTYHVTLNEYGCNIEYSYLSGTSMSCPYVAGVAGLILSKNPNLSQEEIKTLIHSAVSKVNSSVYIGTGNINLFKCIQNSNAVPLAFLDSLLDEKEIDGVIEIRGTACGITFKEFRIYLGFGTYPESWNLIDTSDIKVENNVLTTLNTSLYKDGVHSIKLEVEDIYGHKFEDRTIVLINNDKTTVYVDDDGPADYKTIGEAANNTGYGDKIFVYNGTYYENAFIDESISLIGENKNTTIIVGYI
jgi:subtilisin family serine protease